MKEDKPTPRKILAAVIGFLGIVALNTGSDGISFSVGDVLILASSFCMVASSVISKRIYNRVSPISATGISQLFGGAVLLIVGFAAGGTVSFALDRSVWIMVYICFASTVSYCLWNTVLKSGELSKLFIIKFAEPVFACLFGALILNENIWKLQYLLAFVLIFGGIWISHVQKHTKKE
jgi:drug/metabolite transporter (DMT)-like permease